MSKGWWYRATDAERLAQIDEAIDLGFTAKQVAINCGCAEGGGIVTAFAAMHNRHFDNVIAVHKRPNLGPRRAVCLATAKEAFLNGDAIDLWGVK